MKPSRFLNFKNKVDIPLGTRMGPTTQGEYLKVVEVRHDGRKKNKTRVGLAFIPRRNG